MAATESQQLNSNMDDTISSNSEAQMSDISDSKRGGWITFPFVIATLAGVMLAVAGAMANLIVYLIGKYNVKSIDAAQIANVLNGCVSLFPIIGAILADSFFGCFSVISISSFISLLGIILLALTATVDSLRPPTCEIGSTFCTSTPSKFQFTVLYAGIALATIGIGGSRFTIATMGADQFHDPKDQAIFFNWFFVTMYSSTVPFLFWDDVSIVSLIQKEAHSDLARVIVAAIRKRKILLSSNSEDYYYEHDDDGLMKVVPEMPTESFRFLNRAAQRTEEDIRSDGSSGKSWRLCTVQQVEDLKALVRLSPLWSTGIFLSIPIGIQSSLTILQALSMDRHLGPHFKIPAVTILIFVPFSTSISITLIDRVICPTWQKLVGRPLMALH
ncbi:hypothetical protein F0562_001195 [Nyssa sinensis]|uniref:Nodulin-like domain-containing protein n=1 Tax=Nyssa sinensis TaxID=561372 RepID=A0A5J5C791_9ASTE|nr:hypothetical protein F0562_001195 [Nyssa sinensis]